MYGKYMKENLVIANMFCQSHEPSLYRGSTVSSITIPKNKKEKEIKIDPTT